jgi:hypothetical protein
MIIPFNELLASVNLSTGRSGWYSNSSNVEDKALSVIMLCILYHNKKISRASFLARMQVDNTRKIGTYKSKVLNEWFQDLQMVNILILEAETCTEQNLTFEQYFTYLNLGMNRGRNFLVDFLVFSIFEPMLNRLGSYDTDKVFNFINASKVIEIEPMTYEYADSHYDLSSGWCCDDCDGCESSYKRSKYEHYYKTDENEVKEQLKKAFLPLKTHLKNPQDKLINW